MKAELTRARHELWLRKERLVYLVLALVVFLPRLQDLGLPFYGDEVKYIETVSAVVRSGGHFSYLLPGMHPPRGLAGHPPGFPLILSLICALFGHIEVVAHLLALTFTWLCLCVVFKMGEYLYDFRAGVLAALYVIAIPFVFAEASIYYPDILTTLLGIATCYFFFRDRYGPFLFCASYILFVRESGLAFTFSMFLFACWRYIRGKGGIRAIGISALPHLVLAAHYLGEKIFTGRFVNQRIYVNRSSGPQFDFLHWDIAGSPTLTATRMVFKSHTPPQLVYLALGVIAAAIFFSPFMRSKRLRIDWSDRHFFFFLPGVIFLAFFLAYDDFATRDNTVPIIMLAVLCVCLISRALARFHLDILALAGVLVFSFPYHLQQHCGETSIRSYRIATRLLQKALAYVEEQQLPAPFFCRFPCSTSLVPWSGFVARHHASTNVLTDSKVALIGNLSATDIGQDRHEIEAFEKQGIFRLATEFSEEQTYIRIYVRKDLPLRQANAHTF